ncbi:MAG: 50S ribosomal protein L11 methyltransferase [Alphaproteobacteria bacterium]|nr:50S ribosomal protein L11 methyltransferase [Alphaproteobacteria bacterium]
MSKPYFPQDDNSLTEDEAVQLFNQISEEEFHKLYSLNSTKCLPNLPLYTLDYAKFFDMTKTSEVLGRLAAGDRMTKGWMLAGPYFGGTCLSLYIESHPEIVADKNILDLASGSGAVAITAAKQGADKVVAVDCDGLAIEMIKRNAEANYVDVAPIRESIFKLDMSEYKGFTVLIADAFYPNYGLEGLLQRDMLELAKTMPIYAASGHEYAEFFEKCGEELSLSKEQEALINNVFKTQPKFLGRVGCPFAKQNRDPQ